jgi:soluble lytic murein transglycosylase-like protein
MRVLAWVNGAVKRRLSRRTTWLWALIWLMLGPAQAGAREFRYVDRSGKVHKIAVRRKTPTRGPSSRVIPRPAMETSAQLSLGDPLPQLALAPSPLCLAAAREAALRYRVPVELVLAVIWVESNFNPNAVSSSGAMGLMQLLPGTARELDVGDPFDARQNTLGGTRYLRSMLDRFDQDVSLALAAYNVGPSVVERWGRVPALPVALSYVGKVLRTYRLLVLAPPEWAQL